MFYVTLFIFGLIFGSFATMASYRIIKGKSFFGRSFCDTCHKHLGVRDLVPLFSYFTHKGKCRHCKKKISIRYPLIELLCGLGFVGIGVNNDLILPVILMMCIVTSLVIMIIIDLEHMIIPDEIQLSLVFFGILFAYYNHYVNPSSYSFLQVLILPILCTFISLLLKYLFYVFFKKDALGWGDIKFFAVAGIYLNIELLPFFFLLSGMIGIFIAIIWRCMGKGERFPFGPALATALYICIAFPDIKELIDLNS